MVLVNKYRKRFPEEQREQEFRAYLGMFRYDCARDEEWYEQTVRSSQALAQAATESEFDSGDALVASHLVHVARLYHAQGKFIEAPDWYEKARMACQSASIEQAVRELALAWTALQIENCAKEKPADAPPGFDRRTAQS